MTQCDCGTCAAISADRIRRQALAVPCPYCPADPGQPCVTPDGRGGTEPLTNLPAHNSRIRKAQAAVTQ